MEKFNLASNELNETKESNNKSEALKNLSSATDVANELNINPTTVRKIAGEYKNNFPEYFKQLKNKTGNSTKFYTQELVNIIKELKTTPSAPDNWKTNKFLANQFEIDRSTSKKIAEKYRQDHPEYFKEFKDGAGNVREHYSPELVEIVIEKINKFKSITKAPEGWKSTGMLQKELHVAIPTIEHISKRYKTSNPEYFNFFKDGAGKVVSHYSPELVDIIQREINRASEKIEGWETNKFIAISLKVDQNTTRKIANQYRTSNPEYFAKYKIKEGQIHEHFSPELIDIIKRKIGNTLKAPENWKTNTNIKKELKSGQEYILKLVKEYRKTNPEYFDWFKDKSGKLNEHYSPELINIIKQSLSERHEAPIGWMSTFELAIKLGVTFKSIQKIADGYFKTNPEYFKEFANKTKSFSRYYSPELVEIIKKELEDKNKNISEVPENWQSTKDISERTGVSKEEVEKIAQRLREKYQGQFGKFKDRKSI